MTQQHDRGGRERPRDDRSPPLESLSPAEPARSPSPAPRGAVAQRLLPGPVPQGPVPAAPGAQAAAADSADGRVTRIRGVANAVPGKPDGEVDTRS